MRVLAESWCKVCQQSLSVLVSFDSSIVSQIGLYEFRLMLVNKLNRLTIACAFFLLISNNFYCLYSLHPIQSRVTNRFAWKALPLRLLPHTINPMKLSWVLLHVGSPSLTMILPITCKLTWEVSNYYNAWSLRR